MAKAVIKAMDALHEFRPELKRFLITGASKRGWTTWLVGASEDKCVVGIAPMVIGILNVEKQIVHQREMLGKPSEQVKDYTAVGFDKLLLGPLLVARCAQPLLGRSQGEQVGALSA
jgi:PhoPQ-activated pathogenicity-related protein